MKQHLLTFCLLLSGAIALGQVSNGMVAHMCFSNSTTPDVGSVVPQATNMNYGQDRFGNANAALAFSGQDNNQSFGWTDSIISLHTDHALSYWFRSNGGNGEPEYLVTSRQGLSGAEQGGLDGALSVARSVSVVYRKPSSAAIANLSSGDSTVSNGMWHHVAVVRLGSVVSLYFDGALVDADTLTETVTTSEHWSVGSSVNPTGIIREIDGNVDDIKFYNRALNLAEIDTLANDISPASTGIGTAGLGKFSGQLSVFPNPSNGQFNVAMSAHTDLITATLYDCSGRPVASQQAPPQQTTLQFDQHGLASGIYLLQLTTGAWTEHRRIVIR